MTAILSLNKRALKGYYMASSVEGALAYLATHRGKAQLVAGGTELMPFVLRGECRISYLVDISRIRAMKRLSQDSQDLQIGGATTMSTLLESDLVRLHAPLLYESARHLGTPKVRHLATVAGNVVSAEGNADCAVALLALDAETEITNLTGAQWLPLASLFVRPGVSRVNSTSEIMTSLRFHILSSGQGEALERMAPSSPTHRSPLTPTSARYKWLATACMPDRCARAGAGLYLHIPFCQAKCNYCDFVSYAGLEYLHADYVRALIGEITLRAEAWADACFETVFIGGGTPTVLPPLQVALLLAACRRSLRISEDAEVTIEANPGTVDYDDLVALYAAGINRISLGVQSLDDKELALLGRIHDAQEAINVYHLARRAGFDNINLDLIFGLPSQTVKRWRETLTSITWRVVRVLTISTST
jgi:organic radical activating enzyme